uniref:Uncharacterized protein n=1 Tax=Cacopsylla melanoneura TaxID=428564 RepID=A0A8D9FBR1_9HEMI
MLLFRASEILYVCVQTYMYMHLLCIFRSWCLWFRMYITYLLHDVLIVIILLIMIILYIVCVGKCGGYFGNLVMFLLLHFKSEFLIKLHVSNHMFLIILRRRRGVESGFGFMVSFFLLFLVLMFLALLV